jgi:phosphopantothenate-cysteine ligase
MFYLAAAVSDFFIPPGEMEEHKIQSAAHDGLVLRLKNVPKCLGLLRHTWAPEAFIVSFKLETDPDMLLKKAQGAIEK